MKLGCFKNQMGGIWTWLNIEIAIFWINMTVLVFYVIYQKYGNIQNVLERHNVWKKIVSKEVIKYFSIANAKNLDAGYECGKDNLINETHVWIAD